MESQLTVRLPAELATALERTARKSGRRASEIVRAALREYLRLGSSGNARPGERVRALIGSVDSGVVDLAEQHRAYILESLQRSEEHTSELQSPCNLVCRLLLEKKKI